MTTAGAYGLGSAVRMEWRKLRTIRVHLLDPAGIRRGNGGRGGLRWRRGANEPGPVL